MLEKSTGSSNNRKVANFKYKPQCLDYRFFPNEISKLKRREGRPFLYRLTKCSALGVQKRLLTYLIKII